MRSLSFTFIAGQAEAKKPINSVEEESPTSSHIDHEESKSNKKVESEDSQKPTTYSFLMDKWTELSNKLATFKNKFF